MTNVSVMTGTYSTRTTGLVSVDGRTYPLKSAHAEVRAEGGVAATTFTQKYGNPYQEPLEVLYTLPLPAHGAVTGYVIRLGERVIRGEIRKRAEAQAEYRKALLEGRTAALLEQDRADTFTQKLGCLPPGETAEVEIEVLQPLAFLPADGAVPARWEFRFPTVAGVRYQGAPGRVPDADRLDADRASGAGTPVRLEAALVIADGSASEIQPHSPGRELDLENLPGAVRITLREPMKLDRDLVVRWTASRQEVGVRVVEGKGLASDNGRYLLVTLTPPAEVRKGLARDLTILIDASGSMSGNPLGRAKMVAEELLRSLDPGDRFEILAFASDVERLVPGVVAANEGEVQKALKALGRLEAGGATEMTRAMVEALAPLRPDSQRQVILITDGYIGFEGEVIGEVMRRLAPGARLHTVGIGSAPNRTLTRGAARAGKGVEILVGDDDDARAASRRLLQATVRPVLTDLQVKGTALVGVAPARIQDVLQGQPLVFLAEVAAAGGMLAIQGKQAGNATPWAYRTTISRTETVGQPADAEPGGAKLSKIPVGALFGREAIEDVELELAAGGAGKKSEPLERKIESLGLRHGIASRMTSLVAISEDPTVDPKDPRRRERLAVELPAEVSAEGVGLGALPQAAPLHLVASKRSFHDLGFLPHVSDYSGPEIDGESDSSLEFDMPKDREADESYSYLPEAPVRYPSAMPVIEARLLWSDGSLLILEFEVPLHGFMLPCDGAAVRVQFEDGSVCESWVLAGQSSPEGPHEPGLTVRLALNLEVSDNWRHGEAWLQWQEAGGSVIDVHLPLGI